MVNLAQIEAADPAAVATLVEGWKTAAAAMVGNADTYVRFVTRPGGQDWSGITRDAMVAMVGEDHRAIVDVQTITEAMADTAAAALRGEVTHALKAVTDEIAAARGQRFEVHDDLSVTDPVAMIANNQRKTDLERFQRAIPALAQRWWEAEQTVADQINRDKAALATAFNPRAVGPIQPGDIPGVLPSPAGSGPEAVIVKASGAPGGPRTLEDMLLPEGAADGAQAGVPGLDAMLTPGTLSDPNMPKDYDEATEALAPGINAAVAQQRQAAIDKALAGIPSVQESKADPETVAAVRAMLTAQGVPADDAAVDRALHRAHDFAQVLATTPNAPEPESVATAQPGPGLADRLRDASLTFDQVGREVGDGLAETGKATLDGLKELPNLVGLGGDDAPGVVDSWKAMGEGILGIPEAIYNDINDVISPPEGSTRAHEIGELLPDLLGLTGLGKATLTHVLDHATPDGLDYTTNHPTNQGLPTAGLHPTTAADDLATHHAHVPDGPNSIHHDYSPRIGESGHYIPGSLPTYHDLVDVTKSEPNAAHYWSGRDMNGVGVGPDGSGIAERIADGSHGATLEMTLEKNGIHPLPAWNRHDPVSVQFWEDASAAFAENARGEVTATIGSDLRPGNIWQTVEIPRLMDNPNVTRILQIDPDTGRSTIIFSRK